MNWEALSPDIDLSHGSTCSVLKDNVLVIGGNSSQQSNVCPSTYLRVCSYSLKTLEWQAVHVNSNGVANRRNHAVATVGNSVVVFGGVHTMGYNALIGDVVTCTPTAFGIKCTQLEAPSMARMGHTANTFGDGRRVVVFGGQKAEGCSPDVWVFVPENDSWIEVELDPANVAVPAGRMHHSAAVCGDKNQFLIISGGVCPSEGEEAAPGNSVSSEVWVLDLTAFVVDAPPEATDAPAADAKSKKPAKGAPAGPVKPVATWSLAAVAEDAPVMECKFHHTTYKASADADSAFRIAVMGGLSHTQPPPPVGAVTMLELTRAPSGEFAVKVESKEEAGPGAGSSFGCNFVPLSEPTSPVIADPADEGDASSPRDPAALIVASPAPVALLGMNMSSVNVLELQEARSGSSMRSRDHHSHASLKSVNSHKQSRELQMSNSSVGVRLLPLTQDAALVTSLRAQVAENERLAVLRANKGQIPVDEGDLQGRWEALFRDRRVELGSGDYYEGEVVYRDRGEVWDISSRPEDRTAEVELIARLGDAEACGVSVVRNGAGMLVRDEDRTEISGSWSDDVLSGPGLLVNRTSGQVYRGGFKKGVFSGMGKLFLGSVANELYDGEFRGGKRHGAGRLFSVRITDKYQHNNNVGLDIIDNVSSTSYDVKMTLAYDGEWSNDAMSGHGTCILADGSTYTGCLLNNLPNGNDGICVYGDGSQYTGQWRGGKRNGFGVYTSARGEIYEGKWVNDQRCGRGVWSSQLTNEKYEGNWERHLPNGVGRRVYGDRNVYTGEFVDGLRQGPGTMEYAPTPAPTGKGKGKDKSTLAVPASSYTGAWYKNMRHGEGRWAVVGSTAIAETEASLCPNTSVSTIASVDLPSAGSGSSNKPMAVDAEISYEGEWYSDKRNGKGFALHQSGKTSSGIFENDYLRN